MEEDTVYYTIIALIAFCAAVLFGVYAEKWRKEIKEFERRRKDLDLTPHSHDKE